MVAQCNGWSDPTSHVRISSNSQKILDLASFRDQFGATMNAYPETSHNLSPDSHIVHSIAFGML